MHRLSEQSHDEWRPVRRNDTFRRELTASGSDRLVIAPKESPLRLLLRLAPVVGSEFYVLWVLHTPRGGSRPGRYQSPLLPVAEVTRLLERFSAFLQNDGRHDLWLHAPKSGATLVWDRHEFLYLYGPLDQLEEEVAAAGLTRGEIQSPAPHAHNYHAEYDEDERTLANALEWRVDELRPEDEQ